MSASSFAVVAVAVVLTFWALFSKKRYGISVGTVGIVFNIFVIALSSLIYGLELSMYTLCFIAISYVATDRAIDGFSKRYTALIITQYPYDMKDAIINRLHRGCDLSLRRRRIFGAETTYSLLRRQSI